MPVSLRAGPIYYRNAGADNGHACLYVGPLMDGMLCHPARAHHQLAVVDVKLCQPCADAAVLVFDITDVESFRRVRSWVAELRQMVCMCPENVVCRVVCRL